MDVEFEATFTNIHKDGVRARLAKAGAKLARKEYLQKRIVLNLPKGHEIKGGWLRVRDEGDKITMSLKIVDGKKIENQKETQLVIDNFDNAISLLEGIGCANKAYQETKRELWRLNGVEVTVDEWPFLEPFVEIEGKSQNEVKEVAEKLGFDYSKAKFCSVDTLYSEKYGFPEDYFNNHSPKVVFDMKNPFKK